MARESEPLGILELEESLSEVEKPDELPPGFYLGEVQEVQTPTSDAGNRYFAVKFRIPPEELPPDIADQYEDGAVLFWNRVLVPTGRDRRALYNLKRFVEALGLDTNTAAIDPNEWMGRTVKLRIGLGTYRGETRAEIKGVELDEGGSVSSALTSEPEQEAPKARTRGRR